MDYPAGDPFSDMTYSYDPGGNRDSTVNGGTVDYQNNELNEYTSVGGTSYTSDQRGNLISDGSQSYTYDLDNRLTGIGQNISYKYDPFGKMIEKNVASSITKYIHSGDQIIEEWEGETLARKYVYGERIDEPLVMITSGGTKYYYHFDALGSVRDLTDQNGQSVATYAYDVYGAFNLSGSSHGNPYTFTGRQWDSEIGLYYYRARHYSPAIGRFLQTDPIGYTDGANLYTYVRNSPIIFIDPGGNNPWITVYVLLPYSDSKFGHAWVKLHYDDGSEYCRGNHPGGPQDDTWMIDLHKYSHFKSWSISKSQADAIKNYISQPGYSYFVDNCVNRVDGSLNIGTIYHPSFCDANCLGVEMPTKLDDWIANGN